MNRNWVLGFEELLLFLERGWGVVMYCVYGRKMFVMFRSVDWSSKGKRIRSLRFVLKRGGIVGCDKSGRFKF